MRDNYQLESLKKEYLWLMAIFIPASIVISLWILTVGSFDLNHRYQFSTVFYDMWLHLIHFSLEVDKDLIGIEAFNLNGKTTAYFLPLPALIRGIQSIIGMGESSTLSVLVACCIYSISSASLYISLILNTPIKNEVTKLLSKIVLIALILAPPSISTLTLQTIYVEAVIWGFALFFACISLSYIILTSNFKGLRQSILLSFALVCGFTLFIRAPYSLASVALFYSTIGLLAHKEYKHLTIAELALKLWPSTAIFTLFAIGLGAFNYAKWGNPFEFYALKFYVSGNFTGHPYTTEEYQELMKYGVLNPSRLLHNLSYYFLPHADNFSKIFPFLTIGNNNIFTGIGSPVNYREPTYPIPLMLPMYFACFLAGIYLFLHRLIKGSYFNLSLSLLPAACTASLPPLIILFHHANSLRYTGEFIALITLFSLYFASFIIQNFDKGLERLSKLKATSHRPHLFKYLLAVFSATVLSLFFGITAAMKQDYLLRKFETYLFTTPIQPNMDYFFGENTKNVRGNVFLVKGWSEPEKDLVWSNKESATLNVPTPHYLKNATLQITADALISANHPIQRMDIYINDDFYKEISLSKWHNNLIEIKDIAIYKHHRSILEKMTNSYSDPGFIKIDFVFHQVTSPRILGINDDDRNLSIGIKSLRLNSKFNHQKYASDEIIKGEWIHR